MRVSLEWFESVKRQLKGGGKKADVEYDSDTRFDGTAYISFLSSTQPVSCLRCAVVLLITHHTNQPSFLFFFFFCIPPPRSGASPRGPFREHCARQQQHRGRPNRAENGKLLYGGCANAQHECSTVLLMENIVVMVLVCLCTHMNACVVLKKEQDT